MATKTSRQVRLHGKYRSGNGRNGNNGKEVPWLNISGHWLTEAGFNIGNFVEIHVQERQLIINCVNHGDTRD